MYSENHQTNSYDPYHIYNPYQSYYPYGSYNPYLNLQQNNPYMTEQTPSGISYGAMPWENQNEDDRDMEYIKELYPANIKRLQSHVEDVCDEMDYDGSAIYDEYPDRLALYQLCEKVRERAEADSDYFDLEEEIEEELEDQIEIYERRGRRRRGFGGCKGKGCGLGEVIEVLLYNELYNRRCKKRGCKRRYW